MKVSVICKRGGRGGVWGICQVNDFVFNTKMAISRQGRPPRSSRSVHPDPPTETHLFSYIAKIAWDRGSEPRLHRDRAIYWVCTTQSTESRVWNKVIDLKGVRGRVQWLRNVHKLYSKKLTIHYKKYCWPNHLSNFSFVHANPSTQVASEASQLASQMRARSRTKNFTEHWLKTSYDTHETTHITQTENRHVGQAKNKHITQTENRHIKQAKQIID